MRSLEEDLSVKYIASLVAKENDLKIKCKEEMLATGKSGMSVSSVEASLLQFFIKANGFKTVVEIGSFAGYSGLWMAECLPKDGIFHGFEYSKAHYDMALDTFNNANLECSWKLHLGDAKQTLSEIQGPFDFVFIDANKSAYLEYLDWAIDNTVSGSWIVGDNTLLFGELGKETPERVSKAQWQAMRSFNEKLSDPQIFDSCFIPSPEGMTIGRKK